MPSEVSITVTASSSTPLWVFARNNSGSFIDPVPVGTVIQSYWITTGLTLSEITALHSIERLFQIEMGRTVSY